MTILPCLNVGLSQQILTTFMGTTNILDYTLFYRISTEISGGVWQLLIPSIEIQLRQTCLWGIRTDSYWLISLSVSQYRLGDMEQ